MALTQIGLVYKVGPTESRQYKDKTFVSRTLIIKQPRFDSFTGEEQTPNYIKFEATREETCKSLDNFPEGTKVEVEFIARGSLYEKKDGTGEDVFTRLEVRNVTLASNRPAAGTAPVGASPLPPAAAPTPAAPSQEEAGGDYDPDLGF